jgi:hypothetical protein
MKKELIQCLRGHAYTPENTYTDPGGGKRCKECRNTVHYQKLKASGIRVASSRRFYERHRDKILKKGNRDYALNREAGIVRSRRSFLKRAYGITLEEYQAMLVAQDNKCALCGDEFDGDSLKACLDHCHTTGKNRGLLCSRCNWGIGLFKDSTERLRKAISYLEKHS